jgi:hypothetical protein
MSESVFMHKKTSPCEICQTESFRARAGAFVVLRDCPRCGKFEYNSQEGWTHLRSRDHSLRLSGWVREQNDAGIPSAIITQDIYRRTEKMVFPSLQDRARRVLVTFARKWPGIDNPVFTFTLEADQEILGRSYCADGSELKILIAILVESGFLSFPSGPMAATILLTVKGILEVEAFATKKTRSSQGFVAMSFDPEMNGSWSNGFDPGIRASGYDPFRIDAKEYIGGISDEIITEIRRSRFVVADYTGQKNGVYFEAGFALGLGLPVIPTCREDDVKSLHFDIKHLNTLLWSNPEDLTEKLAKRIGAVISN